MKWVWQVGMCVLFFGFALYSYLEEQNACTELKMQLPQLAREIEVLREDNDRLQYQIALFESPEHLLHLLKQPMYAHLKFPLVQQVLMVKEGLALEWPVSKKEEVARGVKGPTLAHAQ